MDAFRALHPGVKGAYTCWSTLTSARATNYGTRLDYILVDPRLQPFLVECNIRSDMLGSDHCPVSAKFSVAINTSKALPLVSSKYFPEFTGKQTTLKQFFKLQTLPCDNPPEEQSLETAPTTSQNLSMSSLVIPTNASFTSATSDVSTSSSFVLSSTLVQSTSSVTSDTSDTSARLTSTPSVPISLSHQTTSQVPLRREWKNVLKGLPPPPLCTGHKEKAVLRTVKKDGPNKFRRFYVCARPAGARNNPLARCDFFQWFDRP